MLGEWLGLVSLILGLLATVASGISWYSGRVRKTYAAERDYAHLRAWQQATGTLLAEMDEKLDELLHEAGTNQFKNVSNQLNLIQKRLDEKTD